jgi:hypothetical protein
LGAWFEFGRGSYSAAWTQLKGFKKQIPRGLRPAGNDNNREGT